MKAVLYCRVSSEVQRESGTIESQLDYAREYSRLHKIEIAQIYKDDGVSGTVKVCDRPQGSRMLADAREKKFDTVFVFRIDRLARSTSDLLNTIETLAEYGVAVRSMSEPFDTSNATGKFMVSMLGSIAELERSNIAERSRSGMERLAREGRWLGGRPPFGYQIVNGKMAIHPVQGQIVKDIFTWYLCGQRVRGIAARLNANKTKHPMEWSRPGKNRPWYESTVSKMLNNPVYRGEFAWRKRKDQNFTFSKRNSKHFYLLRGLISCAECGRRYVGVGSGTTLRYLHYYRCSSHVSGVGRIPCTGKAVRTDHIEPLIWDQCVDFILNPESILDELRRTMEYRQDSQQSLRAEVSQMDSAIQVKTKERARVISLIRRGLVSDNEGERELALLQNEVGQLEQQKAEMLSSIAAAEDSELRVLTAESMLGLLADRVATVTDEARREIVGILVDRITVETVNRRPVARVCYVFQATSPVLSRNVDCVEHALAISNARLAEIWPRTS